MKEINEINNDRNNYVSMSGDLSDEDKNKQLFRFVQDYFDHLQQRRFETALTYWLPKIAKEKWLNNYHQFSVQFSTVRYVCNSTVISGKLIKSISKFEEGKFDLSEKIDHHGYCIVFFETVDFNKPPITRYRLQKLRCMESKIGWYIIDTEEIDLSKSYNTQDIHKF